MLLVFFRTWGLWLAAVRRSVLAPCHCDSFVYPGTGGCSAWIRIHLMARCNPWRSALADDADPLRWIAAARNVGWRACCSFRRPPSAGAKTWPSALNSGSHVCVDLKNLFAGALEACKGPSWLMVRRLVGGGAFVPTANTKSLDLTWAGVHRVVGQCDERLILVVRRSPFVLRCP